MPLHTAASALQYIDTTVLAIAVAGIASAGFIKTKLGGRTCIWERDWAGKMIIVSAPMSPVILSLIDYLLNLPRPPQILYLAPYPSPLPDEVLTIMHALRLSTTNPLAQLHCESMPRSPIGVRSFVERWGKVSTGMTGEGGRRIDAIVLGSAWAVGETDDNARWTAHEHNFHLVHSLLPNILKQPTERNIRIVSLASPTISAALPTLLGKPAKKGSKAQVAGAKSITTLYFLKHLQLVVDTLTAVKRKEGIKEFEIDGEIVKRREDNVASNIMAIGVIMPWTRDEVVGGMFDVQASWPRWLLWLLIYPLLILLTPSPQRAIQSILFALQAPVRYGEVQDSQPLSRDRRRDAVGGGDVVRDCAVAQLPPVLSDTKLAKVTYDSLEKAVEDGVKAESKKDKP